jgi:hypothetical protein
MLPAGVVDRINSEDEVVHVNRTKEQIKTPSSSSSNTTSRSTATAAASVVTAAHR